MPQFRIQKIGDTMNILVMDAQGGGLGKQIITTIKKDYPDVHVLAVGTNTIATSAMLKAGADEAATGENSVVVCSCFVCQL